MTEALDTGGTGYPNALPIVDADPFSHEVLDDPHPLDAELRDAGPVAYLSRYGVYAVARYQQVYDALRNWQGLQSGGGVGLSNFRTEKPWRALSVLVEDDPPHHDAPRRVVADLLGPRAQRRLRAEWTAAAQELVDRTLAGRAGAWVEFDAAQLAEAFPLRVFPDAVGIPEAGRENLVPFSDFLLNAYGPRNDLVKADAHRARALSDWVNVHCARDKLADGGFGAQIFAAADRGELTYRQAPLVVRSLFAAGVNTTIQSLTAALYALATHPEQWQRLHADPTLVRVAFDEAVRWASPVQTFFRTATGDVRIADTVVPDSSKVLLFIGAANRDPRRWTDPDAFDLSRDPSGHVGFGFGLHQCVGQQIARLEADCLLSALLARVDTLELAGPPRRRLNNTLNAWDSVPVRARVTH